MTLTDQNINLASKITPALRLLYPAERSCDDDDSNGDIKWDEDIHKKGISSSISAKEILSKPGLFADSSYYCNN